MPNRKEAEERIIEETNFHVMALINAAVQRELRLMEIAEKADQLDKAILGDGIKFRQLILEIQELANGRG